MPLLRKLRHGAGMSLHHFRQRFVYPRQIRRHIEEFKNQGCRVRGQGSTIVIA